MVKQIQSYVTVGEDKYFVFTFEHENQTLMNRPGLRYMETMAWRCVGVEAKAEPMIEFAGTDALSQHFLVCSELVKGLSETQPQ